MRNFTEELKDEPCWSHSTEKLFRETGVPSQDIVLQNREELIGFCEFLERENVRSYLEIGNWTGKLVTVLHRLFSFDKLAAADIGWTAQIGLPFSVPEDAQFFLGDSHSQEYREWRESLGHIDMVLIDGDHSYEGVRRDFEINREYPHRFLAFHDIANSHPQIQGVAQLWKELEGNKTEIVYPHKDFTTMGIGVWSAS
jgi:hypothetical protein